MANLGSANTSKSRKSRPWLITAASILGLLVILGGGFLLLSDNGPVAAANADPEVVFDGTSCTYHGPAEIVEGGVTFTLSNESSIPIRVVLFHFDDRADFEAELDNLAVGADIDLSPGDLPVGGVLNPVNHLQSGASLRSLVLLDTGLYTVDCIRYPTAAPSALDGPDHAWRAGTIRVVP
jgi:hypothetical protein